MVLESQKVEHLAPDGKCEKFAYTRDMGVFDSLITESFNAGLSYEFWPAENEDSKKLILVLHGRGDSPEGFHWLPGQLRMDEFNFLLLQAPESYATGFSWYGLPPGQGPGIIRSRELLFALLDRLQSDFGLRSEDLFLFGFSQGCLMSLDVGMRYPKLLGGIVAISGYVFFESEYPGALSPIASLQKFWVSHGRQDAVLPFDDTKFSIERLRSLGLHLDWSEFDKEHTIDEVEELPQIRSFLRRMLDAS